MDFTDFTEKLATFFGLDLSQAYDLAEVFDKRIKTLIKEAAEEDEE